jgi:ABC-type lipoprotein release transport system permease subunit
MGWLIFALIDLVMGRAIGLAIALALRKKKFIIGSAIIPAIGIGCFQSGFAIGFMRMDGGWLDFVLITAVVSLINLPFCLLGAWSAARSMLERSQ